MDNFRLARQPPMTALNGDDKAVCRAPKICPLAAAAGMHTVLGQKVLPDDQV